MNSSEISDLYYKIKNSIESEERGLINNRSDLESNESSLKNEKDRLNYDLQCSKSKGSRLDEEIQRLSKVYDKKKNSIEQQKERMEKSQKKWKRIMKILRR